LSVFLKAEGVSDFQVWDIGQVTVSNFDWLPFTPLWSPSPVLQIANGNVVYGSTIHTHALSTIFHRNQNNRNSKRTKALTYIPIVQ
jgi:hypothetical protein